LVRFHGAARESLVVIPNGATFEAPREGRAAWRRRHDVPEAAPLLLSIGRDDYVKGSDLLRRAWETPGGHPRGAVWVQVGGRRAERHGDRIATGPITPEAVNEWIHASDVGAVPSYYEGGGIALTDMLAGGLYVLSHAVGVAPEAIRPGETGEIVPRRADAWRSALARVLATPPRPGAPGLSADWSWESMTARVEEAYGRLPRIGPA
jgi:glycosyltransferase involved in cell wall biosynthesis